MATRPTRTGALPLPELVPGQRWRRVLPGEERQLGELRRWLASILPACEGRHDVAAVATELGSNAIKRTLSGRGGWFATEITWHGPVVRVAVADCGAASEPRVIDEPQAEHGRGLLVVRGLSLRSGVTGDHRGRLVWADIAWNDGQAGRRGPALDPYDAAIHGGCADLAHRFAGIPAWSGRATLRWWALLDHGELITAPGAQELAVLLRRRQDGQSLTSASEVPQPATNIAPVVSQSWVRQTVGHIRQVAPARSQAAGPAGHPRSPAPAIVRHPKVASLRRGQPVSALADVL